MDKETIEKLKSYLAQKRNDSSEFGKRIKEEEEQSKRYKSSNTQFLMGNYTSGKNGYDFKQPHPYSSSEITLICDYLKVFNQNYLNNIKHSLSGNDHDNQNLILNKSRSSDELKKVNNILLDINHDAINHDNKEKDDAINHYMEEKDDNNRINKFKRKREENEQINRKKRKNNVKI